MQSNKATFVVPSVDFDAVLALALSAVMKEVSCRTDDRLELVRRLG
jgi:hypothetical protein